VASVLLSVVTVGGQAQPTQTTGGFVPPASTYTPPRTAWGDPDLQGVWDYQTNIRMERPKELTGKTTLTEAEQAEWLKANPLGFQGYNEFWATRNLVRDNRTSLIVDPADGKIPPLTPEAQKRQAAFDAEEAAQRGPGRSQYESWEDFASIARCISSWTPNGPMQYNSGTLLMQSKGWVVIVRERLDTRVIALDGRPHLDSRIGQWNGDSRGRWQGNTLVVETKNFTSKQMGNGTVMGPGNGSTIPRGVPFTNIRLVEHFVPISANVLQYYATIEDPTTWTRPWTFMLTWQRENDYQILEYACVEGNESIGNALRGERLMGR
jgi:hypothetical protein